MPLTPFDWNVVVVGSWNRAIYTPTGIVTRLFKQPFGTQFDVEISSDSIEPFRVRYSGLVVWVNSSRLVIEAAAGDYASLEAARKIAIVALNDLPHTPFKAAGYNIRYRSADLTEDSRALRTSIQHAWDEPLAREGYPVQQKSFSRKVAWREGSILTAITEDTEEVAVHINFERASKEPGELESWLNVSIVDVEQTAKFFLQSIMGLEETARE